MRASCQGFTLLELMLVVVLAGVLLGVASLALGNGPARQARQQAHAMAGLIEQLRERAVLDGREYGLRVGAEGYQLLRYETLGWEPRGPLKRWPANVRPYLVQEDRPLHLGQETDTPQLLILSSDEISPFRLTLEHDGKVLASLYSDGVGDVVVDG